MPQSINKKLIMVLFTAATIFLLCGVYLIEKWESNLEVSVEEICREIDQLPKGDAKVFQDWIHPKSMSSYPPSAVMACLYARLPKY